MELFAQVVLTVAMELLVALIGRYVSSRLAHDRGAGLVAA